jgi:hypothetical protein
MALKTRKIEICDFNNDILDISEDNFHNLNEVILQYVSFGSNDNTLISKNSMIQYIEETIEMYADKEHTISLRNALKDVKKLNNKVYLALGC